MIKCLKKLCTFFVIGLPILFVNYSNSYYNGTLDGFRFIDVNDSTVVGDDTYLFDEHFNVNTNGYKLFYHRSTYNPINSRMFAWKDGNLYFFGQGGNYNNQGFVSKWCVNSDLRACIDGSYNVDLIDILSLNPTIEQVVVGTNTSNFNAMSYYVNSFICFYDSSYYYCAGCSTEYGCIGGYTGSSLGLQSISFEDIKGYSWDNSPFVEPSVFEPNPTIPDYEFNEDDDYTNGQIIEGFEAMGISEEYCYGGFASDNIFNIGDTPENFTGYRWGSGVNILDIYDSYSGAYETPKLFLRNFYQAYLSDNYNSFYGTTKSLYGFFDQIEKTDISQVGFNSFMAMITPTNVYEYCYLKFKSDPNAKYDGDNRNAKFAFYSSGTINLGGRFNFSGNNSLFSGAVSGFNNISGFFANMNAIFQGNLGSISHKKAIIPSYILVFMLAIILVRILKH